MDVKTDARLETLKKYYDYEKWKGKAQGGNVSVKAVFRTDQEFLGWRLKSIRTIPRTVSGSILQLFLGKSESTLRFDAYESDTSDAVEDTLLQLLSKFQLPGIKFQDNAGIGDIAFSSGTNLVILFSRANLVFLMRNVGDRPVELLEEARIIDQRVIKLSDAHSEGSETVDDSDSNQDGKY